MVSWLGLLSYSTVWVTWHCCVLFSLKVYDIRCACSIQGLLKRIDSDLEGKASIFMGLLFGRLLLVYMLFALLLTVPIQCHKGTLEMIMFCESVQCIPKLFLPYKWLWLCCFFSPGFLLFVSLCFDVHVCVKKQRGGGGGNLLHFLFFVWVCACVIVGCLFVFWKVGRGAFLFLLFFFLSYDYLWNITDDICFSATLLRLCLILHHFLTCVSFSCMIISQILQMMFGFSVTLLRLCLILHHFMTHVCSDQHFFVHVFIFWWEWTVLCSVLDSESALCIKNIFIYNIYHIRNKLLHTFSPQDCDKSLSCIITFETGLPTFSRVSCAAFH